MFSFERTSEQAATRAFQSNLGIMCFTKSRLNSVSSVFVDEAKSDFNCIFSGKLFVEQPRTLHINLQKLREATKKRKDTHTYYVLEVAFSQLLRRRSASVWWAEKGRDAALVLFCIKTGKKRHGQLAKTTFTKGSVLSSWYQYSLRPCRVPSTPKKLHAPKFNFCKTKFRLKKKKLNKKTVKRLAKVQPTIPTTQAPRCMSARCCRRPQKFLSCLPAQLLFQLLLSLQLLFLLFLMFLLFLLFL